MNINIKYYVKIASISVNQATILCNYLALAIAIVVCEYLRDIILRFYIYIYIYIYI